MASDKTNSKKRDTIAVVTSLAVFAVGTAVINSWPVRDFMQGIGYEPAPSVAKIQDSLELTGQGQRIFRGARPALEESTEFNLHCDSHNSEVSLLGCYSDGRIYVYEITNEELADANKVTMAHELLHAAWLRMGRGEKNEVIDLMKQVDEANTDEWFEEELSSYDDDPDVLTEEQYVRIGTKVRDLPEKLEKHYAKYFQNRAKIVEFYENYQAPFRKLKAETEQLEQEIIAERAQIDKDYEAYMADFDQIDQEIQEFNNCASLAGCFASEAAFQSRRSVIEARREGLESRRNDINSRIDQTNAKLTQYQQNLQMLGELSDAMNSNVIESI